MKLDETQRDRIIVVQLMEDGTTTDQLFFSSKEYGNINQFAAIFYDDDIFHEKMCSKQDAIRLAKKEYGDMVSGYSGGNYNTNIENTVAKEAVEDFIESVNRLPHVTACIFFDSKGYRPAETMAVVYDSQERSPYLFMKQLKEAIRSR